MEGRQCTYNTYKGVQSMYACPRWLSNRMLPPLLCFWRILRRSQPGLFSFPPFFFWALLSTHHACFLNIWRIPPHSMPLLPPPKYCWLLILASFFSPQCYEFCQLFQVLCTSTVQHVQAQGFSFVSFTNIFLSFRARAHSFVNFFLWQTNSLFRFSSALKVLGDLLRLI